MAAASIASQGSRVDDRRTAPSSAISGVGLYYRVAASPAATPRLSSATAASTATSAVGGGGAIDSKSTAARSPWRTARPPAMGGRGLSAAERRRGGAIWLIDSSGTVARSTLTDNIANFGGALTASNSRLVVTDSTIANNARPRLLQPERWRHMRCRRRCVVRNSTITGNHVRIYDQRIGLLRRAAASMSASARSSISNSIVAGNAAGT